MVVKGNKVIISGKVRRSRGRGRKMKREKGISYSIIKNYTKRTLGKKETGLGREQYKEKEGK